MPEQTNKLSFAEKAGYSLGDAAANFVFMTMILFQLNFYTDTLGISAAAAGTLLLVGRLWDAFFDPMMGVMADRTNTRWGKFRPWVLWTSIPWGIVMILAYTNPGLGLTGNLIWACLTNVLLMTLYSANNTPYSALSGVMTGDVNERTSLSSFRFVAAMIAQLIVGGFTLPLVAKFGQGNNAKGWQMTMGLWAMVCVVLFVITFLTTRERILPDPKQKSDPKQDFGALLKNGPWIAMFILTLAHFAMLAMRGGTLFYYFQYYVNQDKLFDLLQSLGLTGAHGNYILNAFGLIVDAKRSNVASVGFSLLNMSSQFVTVVGVLCSTALSRRFGKKTVAIAGFSLTTVFMASFVLLPPEAVGTTFLHGVHSRPDLRADDPADLGDVRRRGGLLGMEDRTAHYGRDLRDHPVRPEDGPEPRRLRCRMAALRLRLQAQRGADAGSIAGHPHDHQRLPGHSVRDRDCLPDLLQDRQAPELTDSG